jgi:hypothetical protein
LFALPIIVLSCQTVPKTPDPFITPVDSIPLESGALVYALIDAKRSRPILDLLPIPGVSDNQAGLVLDRTDSVALALHSRDSERQLQAAAWGNISPSLGRLMFGLNKEWKKMSCSLGHPYWYSQSNAVSVALGMRQAFVSRSAGGTAPCTHSSGTELPDGFREFSRGSLMSCWIDKPGPTVNRYFKELGIPLSIPAEYLFASVFPAQNTSPNTADEGLYDALLYIQTATANQARSLMRILSLSRMVSGYFSVSGALKPVIELFLSGEPVQDDKTVLIKSKPLSARDIALLIEAISVYSNTGNPKTGI